MKRRLLLAYQVLTGMSDTSTGLLLVIAPAFTLRLMRLHAISTEAEVFLSYAGVFVLCVGLACLYGGWLATRTQYRAKLEVVWLLTAVTRAAVAVFVLSRIFGGQLEAGWLSVALFDGALALLQGFGLARGWLSDGE